MSPVGNALGGHYVRLGSHAEKSYLEEFATHYDNFILNANLIQATPAACASLALKLCGKGKGFLLDPWTFPFALDPWLMRAQPDAASGGTPKIKRTYQGLAEAYGAITAGRVGKRALVPSDFQAGADEFIRNVMEFQWNVLTDALNDPILGVSDEVRPQAIIAPYFPVNSDPWLELNVGLVERTTELVGQGVPKGTPVLGVICLPRPVRDDAKFVEGVFKRYAGLKVAGYVIWMGDFNEADVNANELRTLKAAVDALRSGGRIVLNAYGGFYSGLLMRVGLSGFSHAVGYGESKDVIPVVTGVPSAKFYFPPLHLRLSFDRAFFLVDQLNVSSARGFYESVCDCGQCKQQLGGAPGFKDRFSQYLEMKRHGKRDFATGDAIRAVRIHYLHARQKELADIRGKSIDELVAGLLESHGRYRSLQGDTGVDHLQRWAAVLSQWREVAPGV
jgi:hypothetical protein